MGYFSDLAAKYVPHECNRSYPPPEQQLLWRLEELQDRLKELTDKKRTYKDRVCFPADDLRYVLPEHFVTVADAEAAIALAIDDLQAQYGIHVREKTEDAPVIDEIIGMQISFMDILSACMQHPLLHAA